MEREFNIYSVRDELTGKFMQPIFIKTEEEAIRWFKYVLNTTDMWKYNASMYSLYNLGTFNEGTGNVIGHQPNGANLICGGLSVLDKE